MSEVVENTYTKNIRNDLRKIADSLEQVARDTRARANTMDVLSLDNSVKRTLRDIADINTEMSFIIDQYMDIERYLLQLDDGDFISLGGK